MKIKLVRLNGRHPDFLTVGYWFWSQPKNRGTLTIQVSKMKDWRHEAAVWGHEVLEAIYCKVFGVTTEVADRFDAFYEQEYEAGRIPKTTEPGDDRRCPYFYGHQLGCIWERVCITLTFANWARYCEECNEIMGIE